MLSPPLIALLLIANLLPAIALMALYARKVAVRRAEEGGLGSGRLHVRLVALFTAIAAVPTVLVAIFASLLFQSGLEFWFSNRARNMLENTVQVARSELQRKRSIASPTRPLTMSGDLAGYLRQVPIDDPRFAEAFAKPGAQPQPVRSDHFHCTAPDKQIRTLALVNPYDRPLEQGHHDGQDRELQQAARCVPINSPDRIGARHTSGLRPEHLSLRGARLRSAVSRSNRARQRRTARLSSAARKVAGRTSCASTRRCCSAR